MAAVLLAWLAWLASFAYQPGVPGQDLSAFYARLAGVHLSIPQLLIGLSFPGEAGGQLPVGWTLTVEMVFSLLLPAMVFVAPRSHWLLLVSASFACMAFLQSVTVLQYGISFSLGIAVFKERVVLDRMAAWLPAPLRGVLLLVALWFTAATPLITWSYLGTAAHPDLVVVTQLARRGLVASSLGAALLVALVCSAPSIARPLSWKPLRFLGDISYSVYLLHIPALLLIAPRLEPGARASGLVLLSVSVLAASVAAGAACYRWIELPSIRVGNRVCRWLAARTGGRELASRLG